MDLNKEPVETAFCDGSIVERSLEILGLVDLVAAISLEDPKNYIKDPSNVSLNDLSAKVTKIKGKKANFSPAVTDKLFRSLSPS